MTLVDGTDSEATPSGWRRLVATPSRWSGRSRRPLVADRVRHGSATAHGDPLRPPLTPARPDLWRLQIYFEI